MTKSNAGRKTVMTEAVLQKLIEGFSYGLTDAEASLYAGIGVSTLYDYCKENEKFSEQKEALKKHPYITAKRNVIDKINKGDVNDSKRYLERKLRDEFSLRSENKTEIEGDLEIKRVTDD